MIQPAAHPDSDPISPILPIKEKIGAVRWEVRSPAVLALCETFLREPAQLARDKSRVVHETWAVTVVRVSPATHTGAWLLRCSPYAKPKARRRDFFRTAASVRAFRNALALEQAGIPTPRALAGGVMRKLRVPRAGYLLTEEVPNAISLARLASQAEPVPPRIIQTVALAIARLHQNGFVHGDLTINNVLLDGAGKPWFIDLERMRQLRGAVGWRRAVEDFHRFARHFGKFSPAGQRAALRLLQHYCRARGWLRREREFIRALEMRMRHKLDEELRLGPPSS
jgi:tRNA A-37 threonylcarbamoyl transferase component Bud32